ncbi:MAG: hypothetical protein ACYDA3_12750 [Gaiellaceae bacterium]
MPGRLGAALPALVLLGIALLVPADTSFGLWLRLLAATLVVLLPGRLAARALGQHSASARLGWALGAVALALAVTFALQGSLWLTVVVLAAVALAATCFGADSEQARPRGSAIVLLAGVLFGLLLWHVAGIVHGDALQHLARVRKLDDFGSLSLRAVDEFRDGGLHPGYAFPLWHGFLALVAKLGGVDPANAVLHEPSAIAPIAFLVIFESGVAIFRSAWLGGAVLLASLSLYALAPGGGGSFATLELPGTVARQLLVPALIATFFWFLREPSRRRWATLVVLSLDLTFVHVTYALFVAIPLVAFVIVRAVAAREDARRSVLALAGVGLPAALVVAWLLPIARTTASRNPSLVEKRRALQHYASDLVVSSLNRYHLRPESFARTGSVAVAALVLLPLAALAPRRRWSAFVLAGSIVLLVVELSPWLFPRFSDAVSLSQSRRAAGFVPFAAAFAGAAAVLARPLRLALLPVALAAGIVLQHEFPGDFGRGLHGGGPALATWIALGGALIALAATLVFRRFELERDDWLPFAAAALFVLPVAIDGFRAWQPAVSQDAYALTPGLVHALRAEVPKRDVVFADLETSYRIAAAAPVFIANAPPAHVADTRANRPCARRRELLLFLHTGDLGIPRAYGARWLVLRPGQRSELQRRLQRVYADARFALFRLPPGTASALPRVAEACTVNG